MKGDKASSFQVRGESGKKQSLVDFMEMSEIKRLPLFADKE